MYRTDNLIVTDFETTDGRRGFATAGDDDQWWWTLTKDPGQPSWWKQARGPGTAKARMFAAMGKRSVTEIARSMLGPEEPTTERVLATLKPDGGLILDDDPWDGDIMGATA